jgi:hypothetical protein
MATETTAEYIARIAREAETAEAERAAFAARVTAEFDRMKAAGAMKRGGMTKADCYRAAYDAVSMGDA